MRAIMDKFWLKIAGFAVVVLGLIILVKVFSPSKSEPKDKPKTVYDVWKQDDERLRAEPEFNEPPETDQPPESEPVVVQKPKPKLQFKELSLEDEVQAGKLFNLAIQERKMGRLPGIKLGYKNMVDHCREIIQRWPDSEYAFKARRMIRDIPQRYRKRYNITDEEIDLGNLK